ncbi:dual specificity mitogen-activated protein kinase kinase 4-like isoform X1 [Portunus trituberculatus]|uniref:dual specificity mitogen-activated protein kinase kinase 4-like isoform X1 n=2 Tax=Portunus trituberculatus TaxID=210409 RepID=UPI001E1CCC9D|nr:dual specificity mitogen-activated protein kinase kinase 4-like isoform X1 [Portunus trituberculatus]XP_045127149.1 dual specificity mitogen-activated protein kinase kinase 4-like isoform X1 [Portunus trituberculatus]
MAEQQQQQQAGQNTRPPSLNMSATTSGRRSNLRLAFPGHPRSNNDRPPNSVEFPASGYPTTQMHPRASPPPVPPRITISNTSSKREGRSKSSPGGMRAGRVAMAGQPVDTDVGALRGPPLPVKTRATHTSSPSPPPPVRIPQNVREQKKKHLVLHLPPPHHHGQHHRHESLRDRSHKSSESIAPVPTASRDRITRGMYQSIQSSGKLKISPELQVEFTADDLRDLGEIGRGGFGTVNKMVHRKSNTIMAVKRIRSTVDEREQKQLLMDLEVVMRSNDCPCIVQFYGAIFKEGDCWICMELMDTSLDKFYKFIYERMHERLPENMLGKITVATLTALNYLKEKLKIIHRDVKPSNILLDKRGNIKLCDFGISGQLVDSIAKTRDAGCRPYMAPERIDPARARGYDVRSDVWSLGITLMELATGSFPYPKWNSVFEQLTQVVQGEPPRLSPNENGNTFSEEFVSFVNTCLIKDESSRPKYKQLLEHTFVVRSKADPMDVAEFVSGILDKMANNGRVMYTYDSYNC